MSYQAINESKFENDLIKQFDNLIKEQLLSKYAEEISVIEEDIRDYENVIKDIDTKPILSTSVKRKRKRIVGELELAIQQRNEIAKLASEEAEKIKLNQQEAESNEAFLVRTGKLDPIAASKEKFIVHKSHRKIQDSSISTKERRTLKELVKPEFESPKIEEDILKSAELEKVEESSDIDTSLEEFAEGEPFSNVFNDDTDVKIYQKRLTDWRSIWKREKDAIDPTKNLLHVDKQFSMPVSTWEKLFNYQKTGVRWLWELHKQSIGGILADEMGLGKTVQVISFLSGLSVSSIWMGPVLILCPATVLQQWALEINLWWPPLRVVIFHNSNKHFDKPKKFLKSIFHTADIILSSYSIFQIYRDDLLEKEWFYIFLDEGHKIRNPNTDIADVLKKVITSHRIIITGTPIQNNLTELWSLFDFVYPGRLGTLPIFQSQFALPINMGGYMHAGQLQVQTSYKCACILRDLVSPYMLRRWKRDVANDLPNKEEQVILCKITAFQRKIYEEFLDSGHVHSILRGSTNMLYGIDVLRKICNHPFLLRDSSEWKPWMETKCKKLSDHEISGKLQVLKEILKGWKEEGHKVLLFSQTKIMLNIIEKLMYDEGYSFLRMDGGTDISQRLRNIEKFNHDPDVFIFLLTTRVGGIGVNLTGADRIVIYDPDWNPSTDLQARERAWRYGQKRDVIIFRLVTKGTIEEKIYHRQVFKQVLTNRILQNPRTSRFFKASDLHDLFTLAPENVESSETDISFVGTKLELKEKPQKKCLIKSDKENNINASTSTDGTDSKELLNYVLNVAGVHSAHEHDDILQSCDTPDVVFLQREAEKIALRSAELLKQSGFHRRQIESHMDSSLISSITTTHRQFRSPLEEKLAHDEFTSSKEIRPPASSFILENLRVKSKMPISTSGSDSNVMDSQLHPLAKSVYHYLKSRGGQATTEEILDHFQTRISRDEIILFKKLLRSIARLEKRTEPSLNVWILKPLSADEE